MDQNNSKKGKTTDSGNGTLNETNHETLPSLYPNDFQDSSPSFYPNQQSFNQYPQFSKHSTNASRNRDPLEPPSLDFDNFASRTASSSPPTPQNGSKLFSGLDSSGNNQHQGMPDSGMERSFYSTLDQGLGNSTGFASGRSNLNHPNQQSRTDIDLLDLTNPQILQNWLTELGVDIPNDFSDELFDFQDEPPRQETHEHHHRSLSIGNSMKVDSLLSPAPVSNASLFETNSTGITKSSTSGHHVQRDRTETTSDQSGKSVDGIIASFIELLQKEIDAFASSDNSSDSSQIKLPSLDLIASANNALIKAFPIENEIQNQDDNGWNKSHGHQPHSIAPMLGLSLITQVINALRIFREHSQKEENKNENEVGGSEGQKTKSKRGVEKTNISFLTPFLESLQSTDLREIENKLVSCQLKQLEETIERSLSVAKHRHQGNGPCVFREWGSRLLAQAKELSVSQ